MKLYFKGNKLFQMKFCFIIIINLLTLKSFAQSTSYVNESDCRVLIHAGCPVEGGVWSAANIAVLAAELEPILKKYQNEVSIASSTVFREKYSCQDINPEEDVATIIALKVLPHKEQPCIGMYTHDENGKMVQMDLTKDRDEIVRRYPKLGLKVSQGFLCAPIRFTTLYNIFDGMYGEPLLICTKPKNTQMAEKKVSAVQAAENHKAEALKHAEAAVSAGSAGNAAGVAEHAEAAKIHAVAANAEKKNPHYDAAITSLNNAIEHGKMGHADIAKKSAEEAVTHLNAAS